MIILYFSHVRRGVGGEEEKEKKKEERGGKGGFEVLSFCWQDRKRKKGRKGNSIPKSHRKVAATGEKEKNRGGRFDTRPCPPSIGLRGEWKRLECICIPVPADKEGGKGGEEENIVLGHPRLHLGGIVERGRKKRGLPALVVYCSYFKEKEREGEKREGHCKFRILFHD